MSLWRYDARSESGGGLYSTIRREEPGGGDSDDERGSGEYFSGEEFHEDDILLTKDRYCDANWSRKSLRTSSQPHNTDILNWENSAFTMKKNSFKNIEIGLFDNKETCFQLNNQIKPAWVSGAQITNTEIGPDVVNLLVEWWSFIFTPASFRTQKTKKNHLNPKS